MVKRRVCLLPTQDGCQANMGDGVNIAARIEALAKPGAICLSEDAYRQIKSRLDLAVNDLGERQLKNIAEPIRLYSLEVTRLGGFC
jgi:adenylate cyclase